MLKIYRRTNVTKEILLKYRPFLTFWSEIIYKAKYNDVQLSNNQLKAVTFAGSVLQTQNQISRAASFLIVLFGEAYILSQNLAVEILHFIQRRLVPSVVFG